MTQKATLDIEAIMAEFIRGRGPSERETIVRRADDEKFWIITTDSPSTVTKPVNRGYKPTRPVPGGQLWFEVPKTKVSFRSLKQTGDEDDEDAAAPIKRRKVSDDQIEAFRERMAKAREARRSRTPS